MEENIEITNEQKEIFKKRIMLRATILALSIVIITSLFGLIILKFINN